MLLSIDLPAGIATNLEREAARHGMTASLWVETCLADRFGVKLGKDRDTASPRQRNLRLRQQAQALARKFNNTRLAETK